MNRSKLEYLNSWFGQYSKDFLSGNPQVDVNIQFKIDHTFRVRTNILDIAASLDLNPNDRRIAEVIGLLHDIGRFEQFVKYGTFRDDISEDHAELGLNVLKKLQILNDLPEEEKNIVEFSIKYHNKFMLPQLESADCLVFGKLIRDADKLDILGQLVCEVSQNDSTGDECSAEVINLIFSGEVVSFTSLKMPGDINLMRMSWILDVNYSLTLKKIMDKQILERLVVKLLQTEEIKKVYAYLKSYMERRIDLGN